MTSDKPARAPSEEAALAIARAETDALVEWYHQNPGVQHWQALGWPTMLAKHQALALDDFAAQRLSTSLLNPSEEAMTYGRAYLIGCLFAAGWSDVEFRKISVEALQTAFDASFRATGMKITGEG